MLTSFQIGMTFSLAWNSVFVRSNILQMIKCLFCMKNVKQDEKIMTEFPF